jgi:drug/metabolite transporter (DMT)-like permease
MVASDGDEPVIPRVVPGKMGGRLTALFGMYGCCSISMTLLNKQLALEYPYPWTTIVIQHCGTYVCTLPSAIKDRSSVNPVRRGHLLPAIGNGFLFTAMLFCSLNALKYASVALYTVARNAVPVVVTILEYFLLETTVETHRAVGLAAVVVGATGFGLQDKPLEFRGYAFVAANTILVGLMSVYDKLMVTRLVKDQTPLGINLYRITASLPMVVMLSCMLETPTLPRDIVVVSCLLLSAMFAFGIGWCMFSLNRSVAATTLQVANIMFKFLSVLSSLLLWPHDIHMAGWFSIALSFGGFYLYGSPSAPRIDCTYCRRRATAFAK